MSIIRPSSACSDRRIAPSTEVSASSFCGGSLPAWSGGIEMAMGVRSVLEGPTLGVFCGLRCCGPRLGRGDDRLDLRCDAVVHFHRDHVGPGVADRLLELDLAAIELHAARLLDRIDDVL